MPHHNDPIPVTVTVTYTLPGVPTSTKVYDGITGITWDDNRLRLYSADVRGCVASFEKGVALICEVTPPATTPPPAN